MRKKYKMYLTYQYIWKIVAEFNYKIQPLFVKLIKKIIESRDDLQL